MILPTLLQSAAQRTIERWRKGRGWCVLPVAHYQRPMRLRPAGSDPEVVCQFFFLKVSVSLSGFGSSVANGKLSVRGPCVQATKNKAATCSLSLSLSLWCHWGRSCGHSGLGINIDVWKNPVVYASTRHWSILYGTMRSDLKLPLSLPTRTSSVSGNTQALFCLHFSLCSEFYCGASGEFCLTSLPESSPSPCKHSKKTQCRRATRFRIASSERWSVVAAVRTCHASLLLRFDVKKRSFPHLSGDERPLTISDRSLIGGIMQDHARLALTRPQQ